MASVATRSAAKRPRANPRRVRQTTGAPAKTRPTVQTRNPALGLTPSRRTAPRTMTEKSRRRPERGSQDLQCAGVASTESPPAAQAEAHAAHRREQRLARRLGQLPPEVADVHVHHVALRVEVHVPYLLQERGPPDDLLRVEQEILQQLEFLGRQVERFPVHRDRVPQAVERQGSVAEDLEPLGPAPPVQRPDPGQQLVEPERLGEVVVRARIEPPHHVLRGVPGGEHQDRRVPALAPQLGGDLEPVLLGEHDVEQDDVVLVDVGQQGGLVAVRGHVHHVALFLQALLDEARDFPVVFHHEDFHGSKLGVQVMNRLPRPV